MIVTNTLGDSRAGLELLLAYGLDEARRVSAPLVERHLKPEPRVAEARAAVLTGKVHAMMDLSDGLAGDLRHVLKASRVGAELLATSIPISRAAKETARKNYSAKAPFIAALEVIVYSGAIMVLFVFVLIMLNTGGAAIQQERHWLTPWIWALTARKRWITRRWPARWREKSPGGRSKGVS